MIENKKKRNKTVKLSLKVKNKSEQLMIDEIFVVAYFDEV